MLAHLITVTYSGCIYDAYRRYDANTSRMFTSIVVLLNHESLRRDGTFVSHKNYHALTLIKLGHQNGLYFGNLGSKRDRGNSEDYVEMQWFLMQQRQSEDFVIAAGGQWPVRSFGYSIFKGLSMVTRWVGQEVEENGIDFGSKPIIQIYPRYFSVPKLKPYWVPHQKFSGISIAHQKLHLMNPSPKWFTKNCKPPH